ncbi:hypothetical protein NPIL_91551 [Nephila pilipes]|uniref:Uncharacterized protein n=1 Tax=Nephila pilipes TaxID=299642 RepID=A0A8X6NXE6_NEPPI|nr:hypothetical protein NPIL_91551 [Nephila pilipes]
MVEIASNPLKQAEGSEWAETARSRTSQEFSVGLRLKEYAGLRGPFVKSQTSQHTFHCGQGSIENVDRDGIVSGPPPHGLSITTSGESKILENALQGNSPNFRNLPTALPEAITLGTDEKMNYCTLPHRNSAVNHLNRCVLYSDESLGLMILRYQENTARGGGRKRRKTLPSPYNPFEEGKGGWRANGKPVFHTGAWLSGESLVSSSLLHKYAMDHSSHFSLVTVTSLVRVLLSEPCDRS